MYDKEFVAIIGALIVLGLVFILGLMYSPLLTLLFGLAVVLFLKFA